VKLQKWEKMAVMELLVKRWLHILNAFSFRKLTIIPGNKKIVSYMRKQSRKSVLYRPSNAVRIP
jgi:hypothetical protein